MAEVSLRNWEGIVSRLEVAINLPGLTDFTGLYEREIVKGGVFVETPGMEPTIKDPITVVLRVDGVDGVLRLHGEVVQVMAGEQQASGQTPGVGVQLYDLDSETHASIKAVVDGESEQWPEIVDPEVAKLVSHLTGRVARANSRELLKDLELSDDPTVEEIDEAFQLFTRQYHPDRFASLGSEKVKDLSTTLFALTKKRLDKIRKEAARSAKARDAVKEKVAEQAAVDPIKGGTTGPLQKPRVATEASRRSSTGPQDRPGSRPVTRPGSRPVPRPATGPQSRPGTQPVPRPGTQPVPRPATGPQSRPGTQPVPRPGTKPVPRSETGPQQRVGTQPVPRPGTGPVPRPGTGPQQRVGTQPVPRPGTGPVPQPDVAAKTRTRAGLGGRGRVDPLKEAARGRMALRRKAYKEASNHFARAVLADPDSAEYLALLGRATFLADRERHDEAQKLLDKAAALDPNYEWTWVYMGQMAKMLDNEKRAMEHFRQALRINPNNSEAKIEVRVHERRGKAKAAAASETTSAKKDKGSLLGGLFGRGKKK